MRKFWEFSRERSYAAFMLGSWRRSSYELYKIYKQPDIVKCVKLQRLKWAGHLARMNEDRCRRKVFLAKTMGNKPRGRPLLRWTDCVEKDPKIRKVKNWKTVAKSWDAWRRLLARVALGSDKLDPCPGL
ncbi:putative endonuclease-reverse transcriptase [Trichonephila clavipes]|nr:putative endonuclease-reverse transcriptase [Trichonephila clavipes]